MSTTHRTPEQIADWWEHRLADLRATLTSVQAEAVSDEDSAPQWREMMADRLMRLHNDVAEVERVLVEWRKLAAPSH